MIPDVQWFCFPVCRARFPFSVVKDLVHSKGDVLVLGIEKEQIRCSLGIWLLKLNKLNKTGFTNQEFRS